MNRAAFRQHFFKQLEGVQSIQPLLDLLPDVAFFMKDRQGRFVMHNRRALEYCRVASEEETIGKTDHDFFPKERADAYVQGDQRVMRTGIPIINEVQAAPEEEGSDKLIVYSKIPLKDRKGNIIGLAGIHREVEGMRAAPSSYDRLSKAVQYLHANHARPVTTSQLARMVGISHSQFTRRFRKLIGTTLRQYLLRIRVHAACRLLSGTDKSITDIAMEVGFYDHSHFTRTFSRLMGLAPLAYRKRHQ